MGKGFNFGSNKKHIAAVLFVKNCLDDKYDTTTEVGELPCDIIIRRKNTKDVLCYMSVIKTTKSSLYGATTLSEWHFAYQNKQNFIFAVVVGDCQTKTSTDIFYYTPQQFCEISSLPPFYYKCSVRRKYRSEKYKKMNFDKKNPITNENNSYVLLEEKTKPTKGNIDRALKFFNMLR